MAGHVAVDGFVGAVGTGMCLEADELVLVADEDEMSVEAAVAAAEARAAAHMSRPAAACCCLCSAAAEAAVDVEEVLWGFRMRLAKISLRLLSSCAIGVARLKVEARRECAEPAAAAAAAAAE